MFHQPFYLFFYNCEFETEVVLPCEDFENVAKPQTASDYEVACSDILSGSISSHDVGVLSIFDQQMKVIPLVCEVVEEVFHG